MKKRAGTIDFFKFLFALIITAYHAESFYLVGNDHLCGSGFIAVEFFFMVSGYLLSVKASRQQEKNIWDANLHMLGHKICHIFPYILPAALAANLFYIAGHFSVAGLSRSVLLSVIDIFGLQMVGFSGFYATGVSWYISALFAVSFIIYPLLCKRRELFGKYIGPFTAVLVYGFICQKTGTLNGPGAWWSVVYQGLLRGYAGMAMGCAAYEFKLWLDQQKRSVLYGLLEILGYAITIAYGAFHPTGDLFDFLMIPCIFVSVAISFSEQSMLERVFAHGVFHWFGAFSMSLFLNHYFIKENLPRFFPQMERHRMLAVYYGTILVFSLVNYLIGGWLSGKRKTLKYAILSVAFIALAAVLAAAEPALFA